MIANVTVASDAAILSQDELAERSGVAKRTIARIEQDLSVPCDRTLRDLQDCLEVMGMEFLFEGAKGVGGGRLRSGANPPSAKPRKKTRDSSLPQRLRVDVVGPLAVLEPRRAYVLLPLAICSHFHPAYLSPVCRICVYLFKLVQLRCPETAATCGMVLPISKSREMPS